jgi:hypothetical protein
VTQHKRKPCLANAFPERVTPQGIAGWVRADADRMLAGFRVDAARDRDELRADLRARAERAEHQADAYRDELAQLRAAASRDTDATATSGTPPRTRQATQP